MGFPDKQFLLLVITIVFANIGAIIINDIADTKVDSKSLELVKRMRPLVTGEIRKNKAIILALLFFILSLSTSFLYGFSATIFSSVIIIFSITYSLPPLHFSARPISSILYWIILCIVCYVLMVYSLENENNLRKVSISGMVLKSKQGLLFLSSIILFMGIAEVLAKDIRDKINDVKGGRNTFVNYVGIKFSSKIIIVCTWGGTVFWGITLYESNLLPKSISAWILILVGGMWSYQVTKYSIRLIKKFNQKTATNLHSQWTKIYFIMQLLTISSFYFK
jgi:4-hydroxybenzoate polyprenyltransferase